MKFKRIQAGWYATEDGRFALVNDGHGFVSQAERDGDGLMAGVTGDEWAAVFSPGGGLTTDHNAGENLEWFDTKREAKEFLEDKYGADLGADWNSLKGLI